MRLYMLVWHSFFYIFFIILGFLSGRRASCWGRGGVVGHATHPYGVILFLLAIGILMTLSCRPIRDIVLGSGHVTIPGFITIFLVSS